MERMPFLDVKIIHALQHEPLSPYEKIAKKINVPTTTLYRKIQSLKERNIVRHVLSSKIAERIGLIRHIFEFKISSLEQMQLMQLAFNEHPYTYHYNRFYGNKYGFYAKFDIPTEGIERFKNFLQELINLGFCDGYEMYASSGNWVDIQEPIPNYRLNPKNFNLISFWSERTNKSQKTLIDKKVIKLSKLHPIQLLILRDINKEMRQKQKELLRSYQEIMKKPLEQDKKRVIPPEYRTFINDFLSDRTEEAILMDFNRKYSFVVKNLITNIRLNFSRRYFEDYPMQAYIIKDINKKESNQLVNLFYEERPPFRASVDVLNEGVFLAVTLPPYYASKFSYLIFSSFNKFQFYNLDFFGEHGVAYPFYVENVDPEKMEWKIDNDWMIDSVIDRINAKLKNGKFGENTNGH